MTKEQLILVAQGRSYIANGTGKAVRMANRLSLQDWAGAMAAVLGESVSPSTVCRYELHQRRGGPRHAAAYATVVNALLAGAPS